MNENRVAVAAQLLEQALDQMRALKIATTPQNVTVWYHHFDGSVPQLSKELDKLLARQVGFTEELCEQLYTCYFIDSDRRQLDLLREAIGVLIEQLSNNVVQEFTEELGIYDEVLAQCGEQLDEIPNADDLKLLVSLLSDASDRARQSACTSKQTIDKIQSELAELRTAFGELEKHAMEDPLTGVANRRAFDQLFREHLFESQHSEIPCCLLLVDIDQFKKFNDTHGHLVGDKVLRFVALMLKKMIKGRDVLARYGGEEFAIILPETDYEGGMSLARSIVASISTTRLIVGENQKTLDPVTVSVGVSDSQATDVAESLFRRTDKALYDAKHGGRNQVVGVSS
jgi:diguanylate cyclase